MLKVLAISFLLGFALAQESGSDGESSSGEDVITTTKSAATTTRATRSNYYRSTLGGLYFPFAIDQCSSTTIGGSTYIKPRCVSTSRLEVETYTSANCANATFQSIMSYNSSTATFRCDGSNSYAQFSFGGSSSSCSSVFYAAIDACISYSSSSSLYSQFGCTTDNAGTMKLYSGSTCSSSAVTTVSFNDTCQFAFSISGLTIYGKAGTCSASQSTITTTGSSVSTSSGPGTTNNSSTPTTTGSGGVTTTGSGGVTTTGSGGVTTTSGTMTTTDVATTGTGVATTGASSAANMIAFNNIIAIVVLVCIMVSQL